MIGLDALDEAIKLAHRLVPIATIVKVLELDKVIHYRTAYNIIVADRDNKQHISRPAWLEREPKAQKAPDGWVLIGGMKNGYWEYNEVIH